MKKLIIPVVALFFVIASFISCTQPEKKSEEGKKFIGKWVSVDDSSSVLEITDKKWIDFYEGKIVATSNYLVSDTCMATPTDKQNPNGEYITVFDGTETFCYYLISASEQKLELSYVSRGNTLVYKKKE